LALKRRSGELLRPDILDVFSTGLVELLSEFDVNMEKFIRNSGEVYPAEKFGVFRCKELYRRMDAPSHSQFLGDSSL